MQTMIVKWGNSQGVRLPKNLLDIVHLSENDPIEITTENESIIIKKTCVKKSIKELFDGFDGVYEPIDIDWGKPVGKEIW